MIIFFTIPAWFILAFILFCILGAEMLASKLIFFVTKYAVFILAVMAVLFIICLTKMKTKSGKQKFIAGGIGMLPVLVYLGHTMPYLAELALTGSLLRLLFNLLDFIFAVVLFAIAGFAVPAIYADRTDETAGKSAIIITSIVSTIVICFYLFVICR